MRRIVEPEWLDELPPEDPAAIHSRRDLRWINRRLGTAAWLRGQLATRRAPGERVIELGAGDGTLALDLAPALGSEHYAGLDRVSRPPAWTGTWHQTDVFNFPHWPRYPVVIASLFLHHFTEPQLRQLGAAFAPSARLLLFSEPARRRRFQWVFALACRFAGAHRVTRHDGHISIAAGFRGDELPVFLGLDPNEWRWKTDIAPLGAYHLRAERRS
ncbi:hypothetical protein K0B96_00045 [Horticoccus luteus]|uniref:Methyltransferase domain-containing protein n=1 Tax=Horticoccus luteus TaxID=2862869 RepID=A0A8F9TVS8_9BACT|nr:methyltransferase domain-containing protein [Horticoccus luteus]QYM79040.1 hypothetical protein K0B96_00045 [Horticoccus luteus]